MAVVVALVALGAAPAGAGPPLVWSPPVDAPVGRGFAPGLGPFEVAGHAGVDYDVGPGTPVRAAGAGVVAFAGPVAGARFVVVEHGGDLRTSYGQLAAIAVAKGDAVERGTVMGRAGGEGMHGHEPGRLHFGLRSGGRPLDPMRLFEATDLGEVVRLVPVPGEWDVGSAAEERRRALRWFGPSGGAAPWLDWEGDGGTGVLGRLPGAVAELAVRAAVEAVAAGRRWPGAVGPWRGGLAVALPRLAWHAGDGVRAWWAQRGTCSPAVPPAEGFEGTGHHLVAVAGVNSASDGRRPPLDLPVTDLGYPPDRVGYFSYAAGGGAYEPRDTHAGPGPASRALASQLRDVARRHPGRPVDLIGHSQGGVIVEAFLKLHWAADPGAYPPIGRVVTLAAPHRGAPLAQVGVVAGRSLAAPAAGQLAESAGLPPPGSGSVVDLAPGSGLLDRLERIPLPVPVTAIGGVGDVIVTADATRLDGATHVVVDPAGFADHSAIVGDAAAMGAVRLALAGAPPACVGLTEAVRHRVEPRAIRTIVDLVAGCAEGGFPEVPGYTATDSAASCL